MRGCVPTFAFPENPLPEKLLLEVVVTVAGVTEPPHPAIARRKKNTTNGREIRENFEGADRMFWVTGVTLAFSQARGHLETIFHFWHCSGLHARRAWASEVIEFPRDRLISESRRDAVREASPRTE
jgi:hypothetical protein